MRGLGVIDHHHARILGMLVERPRRLKDFTDGEVTLQVSARHVERWLQDMVGEGLVVHTKADEYRLTEAGRDVLCEKPAIAGRRDIPVDPNPWQPKAWAPARVGADQHRQFKSLSFAKTSISTVEES
jgi:DNA-binding PadR family transcriptional regulator